jgi:hypothetical protein
MRCKADLADAINWWIALGQDVSVRINIFRELIDFYRTKRLNQRLSAGMQRNGQPESARERMAYPRAGTAPRFRPSGLPFRKGALHERGGEKPKWGRLSSQRRVKCDALLQTGVRQRSVAGMLDSTPGNDKGEQRRRKMPIVASLRGSRH